MFSIDLLSAIVGLDVSWFIHAFMDNLLWVFIFILLAFLFAPGKKRVIYFFIVACTVLIVVDWTASVGWLYLVGLFFFVNYVSRVAVLVFAENVKGLENYLPFITVMQFIVVLFIFNMFLV
ncbi:MAG: hypothetical protein ABIE23_00555 [archaeon]